jgi:type VI secretion system protein ImpL
MTRLLARIGIPIALVFTILWVVNRFVSRDMARTVGIIMLLFIAALLVLWFLIWLFMKLFSLMTAARDRRKTARADALSAVRPELESELERLQGNLNAAVRLIRESKLARGRKESEALYAVPWILMLGPAGAGKTTALENCGIEFPYVIGNGRKRKSSAEYAGCHYWFSRSAVVLDLAGRIAAEEENYDIFLGFLDQLKRARKTRPLDGIIVTISMQDILEQSPEQAKLLADGIRQRFDAMIRRLGIRFPIYILFTKCDEIPGFSEFFGGFRSRERAQVWGATISREQRRRQPAEQIFQNEFDRLGTILLTHRLRAMENEKDAAKRPKIYGFPSRFASLRRKMEEFTGALLQPTPYSERPMFRGFYFSSSGAAAVQEEYSEQPELAWDPNQRPEAYREPAAQAKSYFLQNLFPNVIFADRPLAKPTVQKRLHRRLWADIGLFALLMLCVVLIVGFVYSFRENRALIQSTQEAALRLTNACWDGKHPSDLMAMEQMRLRVEEFERYRKEGVRWGLRWGLYSGDKIAEKSRDIYYRRLRDSYLSPIANSLRRNLYSYSTGAQREANYNEFYSCLEAYVMMGEPSSFEEFSSLYDTVAPMWKRLAPADADSQAIALKQLSFYTKQLPDNERYLRVSSDEDVVELARRRIRERYSSIELVFTRLKNEGNRKIPSFGLDKATGGKSLMYLTSDYAVPGVFTKEGWSTYFKNAVAQAGKDAVQDDLVLGSTPNISAAGTSNEELQRRLRDKYFAEYGAEWTKFLGRVSIRPLGNLTEARNALNSFSQQDSALLRLLISVADNTMLPREPDKEAGIGGKVSGILGLSGDKGGELVEAVSNPFQPLHELVTSPDEQTPSMVGNYILALGEVQSQLDAVFGAGVQWDQAKAYVETLTTGLSSNAFQKADRLIEIIRSKCAARNNTRPIAPLLEKPLREAWAGVLRDIGYQLDGLWKRQVAENFKRDLENSFPFNPGGRDIPLSTLSLFLMPDEGTLDAFYRKELQMFLDDDGNGYRPKILRNESVAFSSSFLEFIWKMKNIRQALFPPGSSEISVRFKLTPYAAAGVTESLLEIHGQSLRYRNEPPVAHSMIWPSTSELPQTRLSVSLGESGKRSAIPDIEGEWALFRMLDRARVTAQSRDTYDVCFSVPRAEYEIRYKLEAESARNPFARDFFRGAACPVYVTRQPGSSTN